MQNSDSDSMQAFVREGVARWDETLKLRATLYRDKDSEGPFDAKILKCSVVEVRCASFNLAC